MAFEISAFGAAHTAPNQSPVPVASGGALAANATPARRRAFDALLGIGILPTALGNDRPPIFSFHA